jgi:hypothetical protein
LKELTILYDSLRYSLDPPEKVPSKLLGCNDSRRKCLDELV